MIEYLDKAIAIYRSIISKGPVVIYMEKGVVRQKFVDGFIGYYDKNTDPVHISEDIEYAKKEEDARLEARGDKG